jgi:hypothetical protein
MLLELGIIPDLLKTVNAPYRRSGQQFTGIPGQLKQAESVDLVHPLWPAKADDTSSRRVENQ